MATNNSTATATADDGPVSLLCKLCDKPYQHKDGPLMLPCLHSFCKPCLVSYIKKEDNSATSNSSTDNSNNSSSCSSKMACPTCNSKCPLPKDVSEFPVNLRLSHLAKSALYEKEASSGNVKCQVCDDESPKAATNFCCNCCKFLCTKCKNYHVRLLGEDDHEFIELASYEKGEFKIHPPPPKCSKHSKQELAFFCEVCKKLICLYCAQTTHQDHKKTSIEDTAEKEKALLQETAKGIDDALTTMDATLQRVQETRENVKVSSKKALERIDKACNELVEAVEKRRETLKNKCREIAEGKDDVLSNQMVEVQQLRNGLAFAQLHAKDAIDNHRPEEILSVKKCIEHRLNRAMDQYQRQSMELRENEVINTVIEIKPLVEEIEKVGIFSGVPDPSKSVARFVFPQTPQEGERGVNISLRDESNAVIKDNGCFQYQLEKERGKDDKDCCEELLLPKVIITRSNREDETATLRFTPDQPEDEYKLTIMVRNRPIAGPMVMTACKRDYKNFPTLQPTYKNVGGQCFGVAVHDNGTVYATNYDQDTVKVFRPDGTESQIGSSSNTEGQLKKPWGIAILEDTLYVVNHGGHTVSMFSTDGRVIGRIGSTQGSGNGQFNGPMGVCIDREKRRVLVADQSNNRIQFFTSQGEYIKSLQCTSNPYDVAIDAMNNIHVALHSKREVAVYSEDGTLIETYNLGGNMARPTGIHIDSAGYRLITARDDNKFYIADPAGNLIVTMDTQGGCGVCTDNNGTVYLSECSSKRVSIY